jgi:hypothetical protein
MATIYLGGNFVSYEDPRFSHLSAQAREAAYFEQFEPENLREIRVVPMLTMLAAVSIGLLVLASFLGGDVTGSASSLEAARAQSLRQPNLPQRVGEAGEIRLVSKRIEPPTIREP